MIAYITLMIKAEVSSEILADTQADLSLRWAHMPLCWFCHEAAQMDIQEQCHINIVWLV